MIGQRQCEAQAVSSSGLFRSIEWPARPAKCLGALLTCCRGPRTLAAAAIEWIVAPCAGVLVPGQPRSDLQLQTI
jgi:hypothetical protein